MSDYSKSFLIIGNLKIRCQTVEISYYIYEKSLKSRYSLFEILFSISLIDKGTLQPDSCMDFSILSSNSNIRASGQPNNLSKTSAQQPNHCTLPAIRALPHSHTFFYPLRSHLAKLSGYFGELLGRSHPHQRHMPYVPAILFRKARCTLYLLCREYLRQCIKAHYMCFPLMEYGRFYVIFI